jgi:hypothetical protein
LCLPKKNAVTPKKTRADLVSAQKNAVAQKKQEQTLCLPKKMRLPQKNKGRHKVCPYNDGETYHNMDMFR